MLKMSSPIFQHSEQRVNMKNILPAQKKERKKNSICTYKSMFVRDVVGQLEFMKSNRLGHPLLTGGRAVRVDIHPLGHLGVGLARHHPAGIVELVAAVVRGHDVHQQDVFGFFIEAVYSHFERREHPPAERNTRRESTRRDTSQTQLHIILQHWSKFEGKTRRSYRQKYCNCQTFFSKAAHC